MAFPVPPHELALHERLLAGDPVASVDLCSALMTPLINALRQQLRCTEEEAHDSGTDALCAYFQSPEKFDRSKGRLSTFLMDIAKKRAIDRFRARRSTARREVKYASVVELHAVNPKEQMEAGVEVHELWQKIEEAVPDPCDRRVLKLILLGERSTEVLAEALGLTGMPASETGRLVKQHRDRLMKVLDRLSARLKVKVGS